MITKEEIIEAIERARAAGWTITMGSYLIKDRKLCCPLTAYVLDKMPTPFGFGDVLCALEPIMGDGVGVFVAGFDNCDYPSDYEIEYYKLGQEINKYVFGGKK